MAETPDFNHQIHELDRRRQVAEGLLDILAVLNSNLPLEKILEAISRQAQALLGADAVAIYRLQANGMLTVQSSIGLDADYVSLAAIPLGALATGRAALERQPVQLNDLALAQAAINDPQNHLSQILSRLTRSYHAILSIPLIIRNETYGALTLYYHQQFSLADVEQDLAVSFSHQAALAIENAALRAQIEESAVAAERSRLGRELHDSVAQMLFSANLIADVLPAIWQRDPQLALKGLGELRQLTHGALAEMRTLLAELRPSALEAASLEELMGRLADSASARLRQPVRLALTCKTSLPLDVKLAYYRIAQEALNNIIKYASADQVEIELFCQDQQAEMIILDDGCGFDPQSVTANHLGIGIMRERAQSVGARLVIETRPECGTKVSLNWNMNLKGKS